MNEIRRIRRALGMSQSQFAKELALRPSAIGNYESGFRHPKIKHAVDMVTLAKSRGVETSLEKIYAENYLAFASCFKN